MVEQGTERVRETGRGHWAARQDLLEQVGSCVLRVECVFGGEGQQRGEGEVPVRVHLGRPEGGTWSGQEGGPSDEAVVGWGLAVELEAVGG